MAKTIAVKRSLRKKSKLTNVIGSGTISKDDWKKARAIVGRKEMLYS
jgi:hypothetical protein